MRCLVLFLLCMGMALHAADTSPKADLGISFDSASAAFNGNGLVVFRIEPRSAAAVMGVAVGDRILTINGASLKTEAEFAKIMGDHKPGDTIKLDIERTKSAGESSEILKLSGVLQEAPKSKLSTIAEQVAENDRRLKALEKANGPSLGEVLKKLQDIEKDLPRAAEEFKKVYPNGEFRIAISVEITSDKTAKDPISIDVDDKPMPTKEKK